MEAITLRPYQSRIVKTASGSNTIVLLPTGSGKTIIAAEVIARIGSPSVFFVPTVPLVNQQAAALRAHLGTLAVEEYHGDKSLPSSFDVLVSTPKAFEVAQSRGVTSLSWENFKVVVFDEVHHVIKDHPYRNLALKLKKASPRVIGLTASLTYSVGEGKIAKSVEKLCQELKIDRIEHASDAELRDGGYTGAGRGAVAEVRIPDSRKDTNIIPHSERKPHLMHSMFFNRIKTGEATRFGAKLVQTIHLLEEAVEADMPGFKSPLTSISLKSWGEYAKKNSSKHHLMFQLGHFYEALRLVVISWEEDSDASLVYLKMMRVDKLLSGPPRVTNAISSFFDTHQVSMERFNNLYDVLQEKMGQYGSGFRCVLFVKQRVTTHILKHLIESHVELSRSLRARCIYATKSPATASLSVSKQEASDAIREFGTGEANLLIATNVAEEGLDIPAANCVVYFDAMDHSVSYVQGRGRARQAKSSFVMLAQREDRPASVLAQQESEQHRIATTFTPKKISVDSHADDTRAQSNRERAASAYLIHPNEGNVLSNLNVFCKKTKGVLSEVMAKNRGSNNSFLCSLSYQSSTRNISGKSMTGGTKKEAKRRAAVELAKAIKLEILY